MGAATSKRLSVGVIDLCRLPAHNPFDALAAELFRSSRIAITPQVVSAWCRQRGHRVVYKVFSGGGDPLDGMPDDLDVLFVATPTESAPLAYALSRYYQRRGTRTVIGSAHARGYPDDAKRFFDIVVGDCNRELVDDILHDRIPPGSVVSSTPFEEPVLIRDRLPEIRAASSALTIPMLSSVGCPYSCGFCTDWNHPYRVMSLDRVEEDVRYAATHLPGSYLMFQDPNFGVRFDRTLDVIERVPPAERRPYSIESTVTVMRWDRLARLRDTGCQYVLQGVESWSDYSDKAGLKRIVGHEKLTRLVTHFNRVRSAIPSVCASLILGLDVDSGNAPFELSREFIEAVPGVTPLLNTPQPFGGTPLYDGLYADGRIMTAMPFLFYRHPYVAFRLANYDIIDYYQKLLDLVSAIWSVKSVTKRAFSAATGRERIEHGKRYAMRLGERLFFARMIHRLKSDPDLRAFHRGERKELPDFYAGLYERQLGRFAELVPVRESRPTIVPSPQMRRVAAAP